MNADPGQPGTLGPADAPLALHLFTEPTRDWFQSVLGMPTPVQSLTWQAIDRGDSTLSIAPTGSGKTLAAFLHAIDDLYRTRQNGTPDGKGKTERTTTRVVYISPLKALGADVRKNLRLPLDGIAEQRKRLGLPEVEISLGMRTGDTPSSERAALVRRPPDILITTPESLYLMLTSKARESLRGVRTVILDEVHAVAGTKRGAHLALSLERLDDLLPQPARRIGLSATVRPVETVAAYLGGRMPVTIINPAAERRLDLHIVVPLEDMTDLTVPPGGSSATSDLIGRGGSIWFHVESSILDRVLDRRSTIVFVNSRGLAERMTARLNDLYAERYAERPVDPEGSPLHYLSTNGGTANRTSGMPALIARSHHGSVSKERRQQIEQELKSGELRCVVATSSLELGIDMGLIDQVIQVAPPPSVSSGLQRVGRAGHQVGGTPSGLVYPRTRRELVDAAVTVESMLEGRIESMHPPRNPLDILAQQTVAAVAMDSLSTDHWYRTVKRADPFRELSRRAFDATLDMLAGRFPSDEFSEFRPRLVWDRARGLLTARPGAQRLAVINGGTIPDRGAFTVVLPEGEEQSGARRVGELDEEMVYESRVNDVITLGASSWRIQGITNDQVVVTPAPGRSARLPFWHGDGPGRSAELGEAIGAFLRDVDSPAGPSAEVGRRLGLAGLDGNGVTNLLRLLQDQRAATGSLPTDQHLVIERCLDEVGDWRIILHSPYGRRVHAPWGLAVGRRIRERYGLDASVVASDDGIIARLPDTEARLPGLELFSFDPEEIQRIVTESVGTSALFAARFRECAARALLLPRRFPGKRSPLWQQRLRSGQLLEVAREHPSFPILVETARECLQDVYDLPALQMLMRRISAGTTRLTEVTTERPSPFAANLLFGYVGEFMYDGDIPLAERRASLLSLDSELLADLLGQTGFAELLDPAVVAQVHGELQRTRPDRRASGLEGVADLLRELGPLSVAEVAARIEPPGTGRTESESIAETMDQAARHLLALAEAGRAIQVMIAGEERWAAVEDAARLRDALGTPLPPGIPEVFLEAPAFPLGDLAMRYARTNTPFSTAQIATRFGIGSAVADEVLDRLREQGKLLQGDFGINHDPGNGPTMGSPLSSGGRYGREWVSQEVFRRLRLRSLQAAREATRPVDGPVYARQLLERQYVAFEPVDHSAHSSPAPVFASLSGPDGLLRVMEQLAGISLPVSIWESAILPARIQDYSPAMLDELIAAGDLVWSGSGNFRQNEGLVAFHLREFASETLPLIDMPAMEKDLSGLQKGILSVLQDGGAYFAVALAELARTRLDQDGQPDGPLPTSSADGMREALWGLAALGLVSADSWAPLRALAAAQGNRQRPASRPSYRQRRAALHRSRAMMSAGPPVLDASLGGRWFLLPREPIPETARALALAEGLLDRYGVITRGAAIAEKIPGGFPGLQQLLRGLEDAGRILRGRFVKGLGAAQYADQATVNRLRELAESSGQPSMTVALSAADPANPYGSVLPWPENTAKVRPGRRPGALVVLSAGMPVLWLAQSGRTLLTFQNTAPDDSAAFEALARALRLARTDTFTLVNVDDLPINATPFAAPLREAGFACTPNGLCWYKPLRGHG